MDVEHKDRFQLVDPETEQVIYESRSPSNSTIETQSTCIIKTKDYQYYLYMLFVDDMWIDGVWIEILGIYDNRVFQATYWAGRIKVSLLNPINKNDEWYTSSQFNSNWYLMISDDWDTVSHSTTSGSSAFTYYCKSFNGYKDMAAYEVQFYYRHGIVVYIDGLEIYRDNMEEGPVLPTAKPIHEYESYSYRGVIRSGCEVSEGTHIIAVEIHRIRADPVDFDCWLALYQSSSPQSKFLVYPVPVDDVIINGVSCPQAFDYWYTSCVLTSPFYPDSTFFTYKIRPSQVHLWEYGMDDLDKSVQQMNIRRFRLYSDEVVESYTRVISTSEPLVGFDAKYQYNSYSDHYDVYITKVGGIPFQLCDLTPYVYGLTDNYGSERLAYESYYKLEMNVYTAIMPSNWRNRKCVAVPDLPEGLNFDYCAIVGIPVVLQSNNSYTIFAFDNITTTYYSLVISVIEKQPENENDTYWWIIVVIVGLIICCIGVYFWILHNQEKKKKKQIILPVIQRYSMTDLGTETGYTSPSQFVMSEPIIPSLPSPQPIPAREIPITSTHPSEYSRQNINVHSSKRYVSVLVKPVADDQAEPVVNQPSIQ